MAQVPDTNTFTLQDVVDVISPSSETLLGCYDDVDSDEWDATYNVDPSSLLNFRNYGGVNTSYEFNQISDWSTKDGEESSGTLRVFSLINKTGSATPDGSISFTSMLKILAFDQDRVSPCNPTIVVDMDFFISHTGGSETIYTCEFKNIPLVDNVYSFIIDDSINIITDESPLTIDCSVSLTWDAPGCIPSVFDVSINLITSMSNSAGNIKIGSKDEFDADLNWYNAVIN